MLAINSINHFGVIVHSWPQQSVKEIVIRLTRRATTIVRILEHNHITGIENLTNSGDTSVWLLIKYTYICIMYLNGVSNSLGCLPSWEIIKSCLQRLNRRLMLPPTELQGMLRGNGRGNTTGREPVDQTHTTQWYFNDTNTQVRAYIVN